MWTSRFLVVITQGFFADQHHFDNPVYAYQTVSKSQPNLLENGNLNNGVTIKNNLSIKDDKNREWEKLGTFTFDDDVSSLGKLSVHTKECPFSSLLSHLVLVDRIFLTNSPFCKFSYGSFPEF